MFPLDVNNIMVKGVPFAVVAIPNGYYVAAVSQKAIIDTSPLIISFNPPVAPEVGTPQIEQALAPYLGS